MYNHIVQNADTVIFSPAYRLTPEFQVPVPQQDVAATVEYVYQHAEEWGVDKERIILSGDSAGSNIAIGASLLLKDRHENLIKCMIIFQPMINDFIYAKPRPGAHEGEKNWGTVIERSFEMLSKDFKN